MFPWTAYPFLRITTMWILGIIAGTKWFIGFTWVFYTIVILFAGFICLAILIQRKKYDIWRTTFGGLMCLLLFLLGGYHSSNYTQAIKNNHLVKCDTILGFTGVVNEDIQETGKFYKTNIKISKTKDLHSWIPSTGKMIIYYPKSLKLNYGDEIIVNGTPATIPPPANPYEFNYQHYLKYQNITHQHFVAEPQHIMIIAEGKGWHVYSKILQLRTYSTKLFKNYIGDKQEYSVAMAMVLGVKDEVDNEMVRAYGATGAMHVLAVSGLHVGIVFGFMLMVFGQIRRFRYGRIAFAIINLLVLWTYALLTGFSPSALRATIMFSTIILAKTFQRQTSIYNSIFLAAFVILTYDPFMIFSIGFQLSFLAVTGIVYLTPKFYQVLEIQNKWIDKIWMLICVSFSAQIATLPITVLHFHQAPVYFWAVNLVVIPAAFIILISGLMMIIFGNFAWVAYWLGEGIALVISIMNKIIFTVESLPGSAIFPLHITPIQALIGYLTLILILMFFYYKKYRYLQLGFIFLVIFVIIDAIDEINKSKQLQIVFYQLQGNTAIDFVDGKNSFLYADAELLSDHQKLNFSILPYRITKGLDCKFRNNGNMLAIKSYDSFDVMVFHEKKVVYVKDQINHLALANKISTDYLVVGNNSVKDLAILEKNFKTRFLIINGANSTWLVTRLYHQAREMNINCVSLPHQGAQIIHL